MANFTSLPLENRAQIFKNMERVNGSFEGMQDAASLSLVSKEFLPYGRAILYGTIEIYTTTYWDDVLREILDSQVKAVITYPHLGTSVQILRVDLQRFWSVISPDVICERDEVPSLYYYSEQDIYPYVRQLAQLLRHCVNLEQLTFIGLAPDELLYLLRSLKGLRNLQALELLGVRNGQNDALETGGLEYNAVACGSRTNWLSKVLRELQCHKHLGSLQIQYAVPFTADEPEDQLGKLDSVVAGQSDLSLLSVGTGEIRCGYSTNFFFQMFDINCLVHLSLSLMDSTMNRLIHNLFPNVTHLSLEDDPPMSFFQPAEASVLWSQFPALKVFAYRNWRSSGQRITFNVNRTNLPEFTTFLRSLPRNLQQLRFIDQEYFYQANMREVDALWKNGQLPHLVKIIMYRDHKRGENEQPPSNNYSEDITLLLKGESTIVMRSYPD